MSEINFSQITNEPAQTNAADMPRIKVIGVGGGGKNSLNRLLEANLANVEFIAANTNANSLNESKAGIKILLGRDMPGVMGLGTGGRQGLARKAALADKDEIAVVLDEPEMVFITATLGGGTGSGAAPVIASIAHEMGALVVAFVTRPFKFEGPRRAKKARESIKNLNKYVDVLFEFKNEMLFELSPEISLQKAFASVDRHFAEALQCFVELLQPGVISFDSNELRRVIDGFYEGCVAIGSGTGENMAAEAVEMAMADKAFKCDKGKVKLMVLNITAGPEFSYGNLDKVCNLVQKTVGNDADIHFSFKTDNSMTGRIRLTVVFLRPRSR